MSKMNKETMKFGGVFGVKIFKHKQVIKAIECGDLEREAFYRAAAAGASLGDYELVNYEESCNVVPDAGINAILDVFYGPAPKPAAWYVGCFTSNVVPAANWLSNWAGASSGPKAAELPAASMTVGSRPLITFDDWASSKNIVSDTAATITLSASSGSVSLYGATLNSVDTVAYNFTDKLIGAATLFSVPKTGLGPTDVISIIYSITGSST